MGGLDGLTGGHDLARGTVDPGVLVTVIASDAGTVSVWLTLDSMSVVGVLVFPKGQCR